MNESTNSVEPELLTAIKENASTAVMVGVVLVIAGLLAQGLSLQDAAVAGVDIHARAGDLAAAGGERGLIASDLLAEVRALVNE